MSDAFPFSESQESEAEAVQAGLQELVESCLVEGNPEALLDFVDYHVLQDPPAIDLLHDLADEIHSRMISLRANHFELRSEFLHQVKSRYGVDLSLQVPVGALHEYHLADSNSLIEYVAARYPSFTKADRTALRKTLRSSQRMGQQLHADVELSEELYYYVIDWIDALGIMLIRRHWQRAGERHQDHLLH